jgi:hypothetical protein
VADKTTVMRAVMQHLIRLGFSDEKLDEAGEYLLNHLGLNE